MKSRLIVYLSLIILSFGLSHVDAVESKAISLSVQKGETISIRVPVSWQHTILPTVAGLPPTFKVTTSSNSFSLHVTILADSAGRFANHESVDRAAARANQHYVAGSVEKSIHLTQLRSTNGYGCYSVFTDAQYTSLTTPPKGEFRSVTSGLFAFSKYVASFTLLTNDPNSPESREALRLISEGILVQ